MIPQDVKNIIQTLNKAGYEAYVVGGAVRDFALHQNPHDWDIATNALPEQVKALFSKTIDTGLKHGTVTAMLNNVGYEITTYRVDGEYSDGRHPDEVQFTASLKDDLARRDFTINALAMDINGQVIDYFGGLEDLSNKKIRAVGNPDKRFAEDALRMMRAIRFSSKLGFDIDKETYASIIRNTEKLSNVSQERITSEMQKILESNHPQKFILLYELGLSNVYFPELNTIDLTQLTTTTNNMAKTNDSDVRWALLFSELDRHNTTSIMKRFKFSNKQQQTISTIISDGKIKFTNLAQIRRYAGNRSDYLLRQVYDYRMIKLDKSTQTEWFNLIQQCRNDGSAISMRDLQINGNDLQALGLAGVEIKEMQESLYNYVLTYPEKNNRKELIAQAKQIIEHDSIEQTQSR